MDGKIFSPGKRLVKVGNTTSGTREIVNGVPQRNVLGSLLFLVHIYIDDMSELPLIGKLTIFADDTAIVYTEVGQQNLLRRHSNRTRPCLLLLITDDYFFKNRLLVLSIKKSFITSFGIHSILETII